MSGRLVVKVCGLTNLEDARGAIEAGADWLGFIVNGTSPRRIDPATARGIVRALPVSGIVAVMVAPTPDEALAIAREVGALRVQLHRVDPATWPADFPLPLAFSVPVDAAGTLTAPLPPERHLVLLDTADASLAGGTGRTFPWDAAATIARTRDVLLAGGLGPDNVADAVSRVRPFGVDASSRLERAPGLKDPERVRRYVEAARTAIAGAA
jgi:phosphoribosylanthranilate isomerase